MKLVPLKCPNCSQLLAPEDNDAVIVCANCGTAVELGEGGPARIEVRFSGPRSPMPPETNWLPYWIFDGKVQITGRSTQGGSRDAAQDSAAFWAAPRRLYVPAWSQPVEAAIDLGKTMIEQQPSLLDLERPPKPAMKAAVLFADEALKLLEFIVLTIEAQRRDWLRDLTFTLEMGPAQLWALPARTRTKDES
jgi:hypothetical protein